jgi:amino acid adenylation domain-containing protein
LINSQKSLAEYIFRAIEKFSSYIAIKIENRLISYEELNENALNVANMLLENGALNETIGIVGQRKASSFFGILGILYSGCNYTPLNTKYSKVRLINILRSANVRYIVGDEEDLKTFLQLIGNEYKFQGIILPEGKSHHIVSWIDKSYHRQIKKPIYNNGQDIAYILFTSGSTGLPKGVQVRNSNLVSFLEGMNNIYKLDPGFHASQTFDLSFDPSVSDMFFTWFNGGVLCVLPEIEKILPSEYINREEIHFWNSVPSLASFMLKMGTLKPGIFPSLRYSMFCGEQFPKNIADSWRLAAPNSTIENLYGPTEATIYISRYKYEITDENKQFKNNIIPIGQPFPNQKVEIINENNLPVKRGEIGELCFKGSQITKGYFNEDVKTNEVFVGFQWDDDENINKWYKTGDLGFVNSDGSLECIGRKDSQIKIAGRRIEIGEIESILQKFAMLSDIVIVPIRDLSDIVVGCYGFTTLKVTKEIEFEIRKNSELSLEKVFFPKKIIHIEQFPLTASGKINRRELEQVAKNIFCK